MLGSCAGKISLCVFVLGEVHTMLFRDSAGSSCSSGGPSCVLDAGPLAGDADADHAIRDTPRDALLLLHTFLNYGF